MRRFELHDLDAIPDDDFPVDDDRTAVPPRESPRPARPPAAAPPSPAPAPRTPTPSADPPRTAPASEGKPVRHRRVRWAVVALVLAAGTSLLAGAASGHKVKVEPPTASLTPVAAQPAPTTEPVPAALPAIPDAVRDAEEAERVLRQRETELLQSLKKLDVTLAEFKPGDLKKEKQSLEDMKRVIQHLRDYSGVLTRGHGEAMKHLRLYRGSLEKAPEKLTASATAYEKFAADEADEFFKEQYLDMALKMKLIATQYATRAKDLVGTEAELNKKVEFVAKSQVFLDRVEKFVDLLSAGQGDGAELQKYLQQLNQYIGHFETSLKQFKAVTDRIATPPPTTFPPKR